MGKKKTVSKSQAIKKWKASYQKGSPAEKIMLAHQISKDIRKMTALPHEAKKEIKEITKDYSLAVAVYHLEDRVTDAFVDKVAKAVHDGAQGISPAHFTVLSRVAKRHQEEALAASIENKFSVIELRKYVREKLGGNHKETPFRPLVLITTIERRLKELNRLFDEAKRKKLVVAMERVKPANRKPGARTVKAVQSELVKLERKIADLKTSLQKSLDTLAPP